VIPLVNHAWALSFARVQMAKKAIAARGWGPLNYILLDHKTLQKFVKPTTRNPLQTRTMLEVNFDGNEAGSHLASIFEDNKLCASR
jgi:hypothetical protein